MTAPEFATLVAAAQTEGALNRLMSQYWPEIVATFEESRMLSEQVLARYVELASPPCERGRHGCANDADLEGVLQ